MKKMAIEKREQENIFKDFKSELNSFKEQIEKKASWETVNIDIEKYEKSLWNGLKSLENNISDSSEKNKFSNIVDKLISPTEQVDINDIIFLETILDWLESKEIEQTDLESLQETIRELSPTKKNLSNLQQTVLPETKKVEEVKKKIETYKEKLKTFSKEHPIWTKALIILLPTNLIWLFKKKEKNISSTASNSMWWGWYNINKLKLWLSFLNDFFAKIAVMFFSLPFIGAPKEMQDLLDEMSNLKDVDPKILTQLWGSMEEVVSESKEIAQDKLDKAESMLQNMLKSSLWKYVEQVSWKKLSEKEIDDLIKEMELKQLLKDNTEDIDGVIKALEWKKYSPTTNGLWAGWETVTLPGKIFGRVTSVLMKHNYIKATDFGVYFARKSGEMFIGVMWLFGSWVEYLKWHIDWNNFADQIRELLWTSPDTAKEILWVMLYRHGGLVFSTLWKLSEYIWKTIISGFTWESKFTQNIKDVLKWEINEYVRIMRQIQTQLPAWLKNSVGWIDLFEKMVWQLDEVNVAIKIIKENSSIDGDKLIQKMEDKMWKSPEYLNSLKWVSSSSLKSSLSASIKNIWVALDTKVWDISSKVVGMFKWINSETKVLNSVSKSVQQQTKYLSEVVQNDDIFKKASGQLSKFKTLLSIAEIDYINDKMVYKFKDVKTANDFFKNLVILSKKTPELVWQIFDKMPIFAIAWLTAAMHDKNSNNSYLKELATELTYLIPLWGSGYMLYDALYLHKPNYAQATTAWVLLWTEVWYVWYKIWTKDIKWLVEYIVKPWKDILDIASFASKTVFTGTKFVSDSLKLYKNWQLSSVELSKLLEKSNFSKLWSLLKSWKWKIWLLLLAIFGTYELAFADDKFKDNLDKLKEDCNDNMKCMDEKIKKIWNDLGNDTRAQFVALSITLRTWYEDIHWEYKDNKYNIRIDGTVLPNKTKLVILKNDINNVLNRYWKTNTDIELQIWDDLIKQTIEKNKFTTKKELQDYLIALWYWDKFIENIMQIDEVKELAD